MRRREFITLLGGAARGRWRRARSSQRSCQPSGTWARARLQPKANWSPLLCSGCVNSAGSRAAPSRSNIAGQTDASSGSRRSPPSLSGSRSMSLSRRDLRCSQRNRRPRSSRSFSRRWRTRLALASSPVWRGRAATSPACRSGRPNLRASASNFCAKSSPASADWRSLANVDYPAAVLELGEVESAAHTLGLETIAFEIRQAEDIAPAFEALKGRAEALYVCCRSAH